MAGRREQPRREQSRREQPRKDPDRSQGVYMISVAAELAGMHPQTLRIYESRGLIEPERSAGNTRLYSQEDVELLRRIQELTTEMGMNLAGVEKVFELEREIERELRDEIERVRKSFRAELVPYEPPGSALIPARAARESRVRIPIKRGRPRGDSSAA